LAASSSTEAFSRSAAHCRNRIDKNQKSGANCYTNVRACLALKQ
jgi:hypothetical protein